MSRVVWVGALACSLISRVASATLLDPDFSETVFAQGPSGMTGFAWAPDGSNRLFLTRKGGQVRIIQNGVLLPTPFTIVSPLIVSGECGLIGMAFDPDFVSNGFVYFFASVATTEQRIIRYKANGNLGEAPTIIVSGLPTRAVNHNGGGLGFGPDGKIYWSIGDNGNATGVDGDLTSLAAKVGRSNRDGSVPKDNPFFDGAGPNSDYIWASGFRNPFTMAWQPATDRLWLNVVGTTFEQVFTPQAGDNAGWNNYESNQPAGFIAPVISYRTNNVAITPLVVDQAVRVGGVATFTTSVPHRLRPGGKITLAGVSDSSFDGTGFVSALPSPTQFSILQSGSDGSGSGGTAAPQLIGRAITGGAFWDSSAAPATHRGNFFFGDYISGRIVRATLDVANEVTSVDEWGNGIARIIDIDIGPDGNLYYAPITGRIYRASYNFTSQALVVSRLHVRMAEGGGAVFNVRLAMQPPGSVAVNVVRAGGDTDVGVTQGANLAFDSSNWSVPQSVRLGAAQDQDSQDDYAEVRVSSSNLSSETVVVKVTDDDELSLLVSSAALTLDEGAQSTFDVSLSGPPTAPVLVTLSRSEGDTDVEVSPGQATFDGSNWSTPQTIAVSALDDADTTDDSATIAVSASDFSAREVAVVVNDDDDSAPAILSTPLLTAVVGAEYTYDVEADGNPTPVFSVDQAPAAMAIEPSSGLVLWTPGALGVESVLIRASNGIAPDATQAFDIVVVEDQPPSCILTLPESDAVLSGAMEEFFGDVVDDVGAVGATFYVDGNAVYVDDGPAGHYHLGGSHNLFDTTLFSDGPHVLAMTGEDTLGQQCQAEVSVTIANGDGVGGTGGSGGAGGEAGAGAGQAGSAGASATAGGSGGAGDVSGGSAGDPAGAGGPPLDSATFSGGGGGCACSLARAAQLSELRAMSWVVLGALVLRRRRSARRSLDATCARL